MLHHFNTHVQLTQQGHHFHRRHSGFCTFIARFRAGAFDRLINRIDRQDTVGDRGVEFELQRVERAVALACNVFKVRRATANDGTECDHGVGHAGLEDTLDRQRQFPRTRDMNQRNVGFVNAVTYQAIDSAFDQSVDDVMVETADHDGIARIDVDELAFHLGNGVHGVFVLLAQAVPAPLKA
ncbi:ubiquitin-protein ligase [Zymobacter palmae]|uniref:Ubiquitin-protein ligase n=1 Tax=Zymobacter palmae TaxID=33074 RepID=A0A348HH50_9GAMM|nr:ubiquitin-protein ligase [Zymobacter palmae]